MWKAIAKLDSHTREDNANLREINWQLKARCESQIVSLTAHKEPVFRRKAEKTECQSK